MRVVRSVRRSGFALALLAVVALTACSPTTNAAPSARSSTPTLVVPPLGRGAASSADGQRGGVRFGHVSPTVGTRWNVAVEAKASANDPLRSPELSGYSSSLDVEVLAMEGAAISRARLSFGKCAYWSRGIELPRSVNGKTFIVDSTPPHVRASSGAPADSEDTTSVLDVFPDLGTRTHVDQLMPDAAMAIGESRHELAAAVMRVMHPRAWSLNHGAATLARVEDDEAVFAVTLDASSVMFRVDLSGEVKLRLRDVRLSLIVLEGAYELTQGGLGPGKADGTFSYRRTVRDLP